MPDNNQPFAIVVDDEWRLAQNLAQYLHRRGYRSQPVTSVTDANALITGQRPDLALVDLKLPDFNGIELCRMLHRRYPDTAVIVMSACIDETDRADLEKAGVNNFLTKPFAFDELARELDSIGKVVRASENAPRPIMPNVPPAPRVTNRRASHRPRIVLYSHDTMGLGHMRRNILIARSLAESRIEANVLLVSGAREIGRFELPPGIDCLVLPSFKKSATGTYESRHLDMETRELVRLRSHTINASVNAFQPDIMVVDNVPRGALNELDDTLSSMNAKGRTRLVLGLRDVLDAPEVTRAEWQKRDNLTTIQWHYDEVWIYGDPKIYNLCESYQFGEAFNRKVRFSGYLDARKRATPRPDEVLAPESEDKPPGSSAYNLCLVGGGQDGFELAAAFASAEQPPDTVGLLITGPFMAPEQTAELNRITADKTDFQILGFVSEPTHLLRNARRVVAMGGYNTVNEVLAFSRPTLLVPRIRPRLEQLVRAERLAALSYISLLLPENLSATAISEWLAMPDDALPRANLPVDLDGLDRLIDFVERLSKQKGEKHAFA